MKITIYTVTDCQFTKQEKEYLASHNLPYLEKNLETSRDFLTEMLSLSNNFAGTPVTKIEKDDGQIAILKGFTKEEFDQTLGIPAVQPVTPVVEPQPIVEQPEPVQVSAAPINNPINDIPEVIPTPIEKQPPAAPVEFIQEEPPTPIQAQPVITPQEPAPMSASQTQIPPQPVQPNPLNPILDNLAQKAGALQAQGAVGSLPNIPDFSG